MSARTELLDALDLALPPTFRISHRTAQPDQIDTGKLWVMGFTNEVVPGPALKQLTYTLEVWVLSGAQDPGDVDDKLDDKLDDVLSALLGIRSVRFLTAERAVTADERYHGYKITLNAFAQTT